MALRVAVQMDPLERVNVHTDTTFLMMETAQARGHDLFVYEARHLSLEDGQVFARGRSVKVQRVAGAPAVFGPWKTVNLAEVDVVLMRQDPPFDVPYITATYLLEIVHPQTLVINNPSAVRDAPEKLFAARFKGLQPPTLVTADVDALEDFHNRHGDVILKPLHGGAGSGVVWLKAGDPNLKALMELHRDARRDPVVMQAYIPAVTKGDKRIILVDGEAVGAVNRVPGEGEVRSNLRVGGRAEAADLTPRDKDICAIIGPELKKRGLMFVGIDVIGDYLTEINVTSPTAAQQLLQFTGVNAAAKLFDVIEARKR